MRDAAPPRVPIKFVNETGSSGEILVPAYARLTLPKPNGKGYADILLGTMPRVFWIVEGRGWYLNGKPRPAPRMVREKYTLPMSAEPRKRRALLVWEAYLLGCITIAAIVLSLMGIFL